MQAQKTPDFQPTSVQRVQTQLDDAYANIFISAPENDVHDLVICHGNVLRYLVCRAMAIDSHAWIQLHPPANCSLSSVVIEPNVIREALDAGITLTVLKTFNETAHLSEALQTLN